MWSTHRVCHLCSSPTSTHKAMWIGQVTNSGIFSAILIKRNAWDYVSSSFRGALNSWTGFFLRGIWSLNSQVVYPSNTLFSFWGPGWLALFCLHLRIALSKASALRCPLHGENQIPSLSGSILSVIYWLIKNSDGIYRAELPIEGPQPSSCLHYFFTLP